MGKVYSYPLGAWTLAGMLMQTRGRWPLLFRTARSNSGSQLGWKLESVNTFHVTSTSTWDTNNSGYFTNKLPKFSPGDLLETLCKDRHCRRGTHRLRKHHGSEGFEAEYSDRFYFYVTVLNSHRGSLWAQWESCRVGHPGLGSSPRRRDWRPDTRHTQLHRTPHTMYLLIQKISFSRLSLQSNCYDIPKVSRFNTKTLCLISNNIWRQSDLRVV